MDKNLKTVSVYDSDTPVTLKQGRQTKYELVDTKQDNNNAKFENLAWIVSMKMLTIKFLPNQKTCQLSPLDMCNIKNSGIFKTYLIYSIILQSFNLTGQEHNIFS